MRHICVPSLDPGARRCLKHTRTHTHSCTFLGLPEGDIDGIVVGKEVGLALGAIVGLADGLVVGVCEGVLVGTWVFGVWDQTQDIDTS